MKLFSTLDKIASGLLTACAALTICTLFYVMWFEKPFISYENLPFPVARSTLHPGEIIPIRVSRCNHDSVPRTYLIAHALREVNTNELITMPDVYAFALAGCWAGPSNIHVLPEHIKPGRYELFGGALVYGTVRTYDVMFRSQQFDVVPK